MSLINSDTGLSSGSGLQWQTAIGGAGLDLEIGPTPPPGSASLDFSQASNSMYVPLLRFSIVGLIAAGIGLAAMGYLPLPI